MQLASANGANTERSKVHSALQLQPSNPAPRRHALDRAQQREHPSPPSLLITPTIHKNGKEKERSFPATRSKHAHTRGHAKHEPAVWWSPCLSYPPFSCPYTCALSVSRPHRSHPHRALQTAPACYTSHLRSPSPTIRSPPSPSHCLPGACTTTDLHTAVTMEASTHVRYDSGGVYRFLLEVEEPRAEPLVPAGAPLPCAGAGALEPNRLWLHTTEGTHVS
jgi:hypothetical protein